MTLMLLWNEYRIQQPNGLSYSRFCELYQAFIKVKYPTQYLFHKGGDSVQVDFCGSTVPIYDTLTGEIKLNAQIFVGVLPASGYIFVHAVASQTARDWQLCHVEMFDSYGGVPQKIIPDNLKSAVIKHSKDEIIINDGFAELAEFYNTIIMPARPKTPQDKALAEISVRIVQQNILAKHRDFKFFSLLELNKLLKDEIKTINNQVTKTYPMGRFNLYKEIDLPLLQELPARSFELGEMICDVTVAKNYTVNVFDVDYSVPYSYMCQKVSIKVSDTLIEIFYKRQLIATHTRLNKGASICYEHMPANHQLYEDLHPERLIAWANDIGEEAQFVIKRILDNKRSYANNLRKLNHLRTSLVSAGESNTNIKLAFKHIRKINSYTITSVESVFKTKSYLLYQDKEKCATKSSNRSVIQHSNIRGAAYYQQIGGQNVNLNSL